MQGTHTTKLKASIADVYKEQCVRRYLTHHLDYRCLIMGLSHYRVTRLRNPPRNIAMRKTYLAETVMDLIVRSIVIWLITESTQHPKKRSQWPLDRWYFRVISIIFR